MSSWTQAQFQNACLKKKEDIATLVWYEDRLSTISWLISCVELLESFIRMQQMALRGLVLQIKAHLTVEEDFQAVWMEAATSQSL